MCMGVCVLPYPEVPLGSVELYSVFQLFLWLHWLQYLVDEKPEAQLQMYANVNNLLSAT